MITVIHLRDSPFVGGPEKQVLGQSVLLDKGRFEPVIVSFAKSGKNALTEAATAAGIRTECLTDGKLSMPRAVSDLRELLRRSPNPVVISSGFKADFTARSACSQEHVPWIAWFHGYTAETMRVRIYEALDLRALKHAQCVIALCERAASHLRARGLTNVTVVPNGIDAAAVRTAGDRKSFRSELGIGESELAVGVVSRLSVEKGIDLFINSASEVLRTHPSVKFPIIGDGPLRAALQRQAESLGIAGRVIFTGMREDAVCLMKALDVFVLPSHRENLPVALLEAMACGVSVVATDVGGVGEVLDGTPAEPIPPGSSRAITKAVSALLDDHILRRAHAAALLKRVGAFSFGAHVGMIEAILDGIHRRVAAPATRTEAACQSGGRPYRGD